MKKWYCEYNHGVRIHDYFSLMINQFPILVIRKIDNPHFSDDKGCISIGFIGFTKTIILK